MRYKIVLPVLAFCIFVLAPFVHAATPPQKDYLSSVEADKIRDADTINERIKLFLTFADDRLKKFQYELDHPSTNRHGDMLNSLLNAYVGCVDDAGDLIQLRARRNFWWYSRNSRRTVLTGNSTRRIWMMPSREPTTR